VRPTTSIWRPEITLLQIFGRWQKTSFREIDESVGYGRAKSFVRRFRPFPVECQKFRLTAVKAPIVKKVASIEANVER
jgi:hypothetical protein